MKYIAEQPTVRERKREREIVKFPDVVSSGKPRLQIGLQSVKVVQSNKYPPVRTPIIIINHNIKSIIFSNDKKSRCFAVE